MPRFSHHMSNVSAAATVHGMSAIENCIRAYERNGADRLECLQEAKADLLTWMTDIDRAIGAETATHPQVLAAIDDAIGAA